MIIEFYEDGTHNIEVLGVVAPGRFERVLTGVYRALGSSRMGAARKIDELYKEPRRAQAALEKKAVLPEPEPALEAVSQEEKEEE
jgi:hypothetical protein